MIAGEIRLTLLFLREGNKSSLQLPKDNQGMDEHATDRREIMT